MQVGVFIPINNNGWLISENAPQYKPSFDLNKDIALRAEKHGFDFLLSMIANGGMLAHLSRQQADIATGPGNRMTGETS